MRAITLADSARMPAETPIRERIVDVDNPQIDPSELLMPAEVAKILKISTNAVIARFFGMAGVFVMPDMVKTRRLR